MSDRIERAIARANALTSARTTEDKINTSMKLISKQLSLVESDPTIKLYALMRTTALFAVTELSHLPFHLIKRQALKAFRSQLDDVLVKFQTVQTVDEKANDNAD